MKKRFIKISAIVLLSLTICAVFSLSIVTNSQGSDPLVTLSYLTDIILPQMKSDVLAAVSVSSNTSSSSNSYDIIELTYGQCLYAASPVEIIVRPGSDVRAISPFPNQGIADITRCKEYLNGQMLDINSYCLIPRGGDGRGIQVFNQKSYILVRGEYYIG